MEDNLEKLQRLAQRVSQRLSQPGATAFDQQEGIGLSALQNDLTRLGQRLARIEARLNLPVSDRDATGGAAHSSTGIHPNLDRFDVDEATVSKLVEFFEGTKECSLEPGGKPCDHCALCNTRGF